MRVKLPVLFLAAFSLVANGVWANQMTIHLEDGRTVEYSTNNIERITYESSQSTVNYVLDSRRNQYSAKAIDFGTFSDFELTGSIHIKEAYRANGSAWAGFLIRAEEERARHSAEEGYLCFIRENGEAGIHASVVDHIHDDTSTSFRGTSRNSIRIRAHGDRIKVYLNGKLVLNESGAYRDHGYITLNVGGARAEFQIHSIEKL